MEQIVFAQISDVHIGRRLMGNLMTRLWGLSGYNPHDDRLLEPLRLALDDAKLVSGMEEREPWRVVMSGDLTAGGTNNDHALAAALFHRRWEWRRGPVARSVGFLFEPDRMVMVPGNHDHWGSDLWQNAYTAAVSPYFFRPTPWRTDWYSQNRRLRLELYGVDSNSGMLGLPLNNNLFAGGALSAAEVAGLDRLLRDSAAERVPDVVRVRALVCHHAFEQGLLKTPLPLNPVDRRYLTRQAARYRIPVVLTGHTHEFDQVHWFDPPDPWDLREMRSAAALAGPAAPGANGFWVHRVALPDGAARPQWTSWKYQTGTPFDFELDDPNGTADFVIPA